MKKHPHRYGSRKDLLTFLALLTEMNAVSPALIDWPRFYYAEDFTWSWVYGKPLGAP